MEVNDSARYIEYATNLSTGFYFDPHNFWYFGYALFIFMIRIVSKDYLALIVVQYFVSYLAVLSLYKTSLILFNDSRAALLTAAGFALFIEIPTWNSYILAESLFISCTCFSLYLLAIFFKHQSHIRLAVVCVMVLFTALIKPTGIAIAAATAIALLYNPIVNIRNGWVRFSVVVISVAMILAVANRMLLTFDVMENYQKGEVIYDVTTLPPDVQYEMLVVQPPCQLYVPDEKAQPITKIVSFILHHPVYWLRLFLTKLFFLLVHVRPFWSTGHNIFSLFFLLPSYYFLARGIQREGINIVAKVFILVYLAVHVVSVCTTSEDWDGRFLMPLLPVICLVSGREVVAQFSAFVTKRDHPH
ncbi:MAG: hypothetical protein ABIS36_06650 [Chryseolinea sp.]